MLSKLRTFFRRLKTASFRRMFTYIEEIHRETGASCLFTFFDMCVCALKYGIGYLEYRVYGFARIRDDERRRTFMTMNENKRLIAAFNDPEKSDAFFDDKAGFLKAFEGYVRRSWCDLRTASDFELKAFLDGVDAFFAKPIDNYGGQGIERYETAGIDRSGIRAELEAKGQLLLEEGIRQHPEMDRLNPSSINTLRMVTLVDKEGVPRHLYTIVRMGRAGSVVDNVTSGGFYTKVNPDGTLCARAFCDATGEIVTTHPDTGTVFEGFRVPCYEEAAAMCLEAALVVPEVRYVGWDVAITPEGPCFVEGNPMPSYDMIQNYAFQDGSGEGILKEFRRYL